jgi:ribosomal-protein-alanine N-acetyltransferase
MKSPVYLLLLSRERVTANAASIALGRASGFRQEGYSPRYLKIGGRWCDHQRWAILADRAGRGDFG